MKELAERIKASQDAMDAELEQYKALPMPVPTEIPPVTFFCRFCLVTDHMGWIPETCWAGCGYNHVLIPISALRWL